MVFVLLLLYSEWPGRQAGVSVLIFVPFILNLGKWSQARGEGPGQFVLKSNASASSEFALCKISDWKNRYQRSSHTCSLGWKAAWWITWAFPRSSPFNLSSFFCHLTSVTHQAHRRLLETCPSTDSSSQLCASQWWNREGKTLLEETKSQ